VLASLFITLDAPMHWQDGILDVLFVLGATVR
jgi:hypothetical protein